MKYIIFLGDGMADWPLKDRGNRTPMMLAHTPAMDMLARKGRCGQLITIPDDMPPGSSVANMSILGYDVHKCYQGRGALEAASIGVEIKPGEVAMRCNLICIEDGRIKSHSAGHLEKDEADELIRALDRELGGRGIRFYTGTDYRHLLVLEKGSTDLALTPPHDILDKQAEEFMPRSKKPDAEETGALLNNLIRRSWDILPDHAVNKKRKADNRLPANSIWPWSAGYKPDMPTITERFGLKGGVISAVDLIKGLGIYAGLDVIHVDGITGKHDTNYEGKADGCLNALRDHDFVYVHVEASDEAGHDADTDLKIKTIEYFDQRLVQRVLDNLDRIDEPVSIAVLPDHPTPIEYRTHIREPVPFLIFRPDIQGDFVQEFNEESVKSGSYGLLKGDEFIRKFLENG